MNQDLQAVFADVVARAREIAVRLDQAEQLSGIVQGKWSALNFMVSLPMLSTMCNLSYVLHTYTCIVK